jgi:hypothetical protein
VSPRATELVAIPVLAAVGAMVIACPVLLAPSVRLFGMDIVGRHYDPFIVMEQFERPIGIGGVYSQPVTDVTGAIIARISGAVPRTTTSRTNGVCSPSTFPRSQG